MAKIVRIIGVLVFLLAVSSSVWAMPVGDEPTTPPTTPPPTTTTTVTSVPPTVTPAYVPAPANSTVYYQAYSAPTPQAKSMADFRKADSDSMATLPPANCQYDGKTLPNGKPEIMCTLTMKPAPTRPELQTFQKPTPQPFTGGCVIQETIIRTTPTPPASHRYGAQDPQ